MSRPKSPWKIAVEGLLSDSIATMSVLVVLGFGGVAVGSMFGWISVDYVSEVGPMYSPPSSTLWFGTDLLGRNVSAKLIHGCEIAISVGFIASAIAIPIGAVLGATAGFVGGRVDQMIVWFYSVVSSIPQILLLTSMSFVLGAGIKSIYIAVGLTSWVGICRLIRAEVIKLKERDYVMAARAIGARGPRILFRHIAPNTFHLILIDFSLRFVYAIKSEAILSFLGIGVVGEPSWGIMIADAKEELLRGVWWPLASATGAMFLLVLALNLLGDALRDLFDPRTATGN